MSIQQFCLRWNNHQPNFISVFTTLLNTESLVDVTLAAEGKHLHAHKVVLSACSVYFQTLFTANPSRHPIVILKDVKYSDLRIMVDFMYYGEVNVSQEQLPQILETAKMLKIKGLTEMPDSTSLTKSQNTSTDKNELNNMGESSWEGNQRQSISPRTNSPNTKKRRIRKTSSGSNSNDRICTEEKALDQSMNSLNLIKNVNDNSTNTTNNLLMCPNPTQQIRARQQFELYPTENGPLQNALQQQPTPDGTGNTNCMMRLDNMDVCNDSNIQQQGGQWTMMEHDSYPRYTTPTCIEGQQHMAQDINQLATNFTTYVQAQNMNQMQEYSQLVVRSSTPLANTSQTNNENQTKRRRMTNPQANENFQRALEAVHTGGIGFCKAAKIFGVNNRTLWLEYKKKGYPNPRPSIKNRIKREQNSPVPERKEEVNESNMMPSGAILYSQAPVLSVMDARYLQEHNLHAINFNSSQ